MLRHLVAFACLLAPAAVSQRLWFAQNDSTTYGNGAVGWPAAVIGFRFTAPANAAIAAAQVFTGNAAPATHSLELRAHDAITGLPGTLLGSQGTWTTLHTRCWQGPVLPAPVALTGGQIYWLVWRVTGMFHQHSIAAESPTNTISEVRISEGSSWHGQANVAAKFRLFTAYAAGTTFAYGTAKPGTHGDPTIGISGWPALGSPIDIWLDNAVRRQPALLLLGDPVFGGIQLGYGTLWNVPFETFLVSTVTQSSPFVGGATMTLYAPPDPALTGLVAALQWAIYDPLAADTIAHTAAAALTLQ